MLVDPVTGLTRVTDLGLGRLLHNKRGVSEGKH